MPSAPEGLRKRPTVTTNVAKPPEVQPVQAGGVQSRPKSDRSQNFVVGGLSRSGYGGKGSLPQGGCGPGSGWLKTAPQRIAVNNAEEMTTVHPGKRSLRNIGSQLSFPAIFSFDGVEILDSPPTPADEGHFLGLFAGAGDIIFN
jgi:hypothetical protein